MPDREESEIVCLRAQPHRGFGVKGEDLLHLLATVALLDEADERLRLSAHVCELEKRVQALARLAMAEDVRIRELEGRR